MNIRPLSKSLQEKAEKELNEVPGQLNENIAILKNWLVKQEHLKYKDDDQLLVNFLRSSKFSIQRAKKKIDAYYTFRTLAPEFVQNFDPFLPCIQEALKARFMFPLPVPKDNPASPIVVIMRYSEYNPDIFIASHMAKMGIVTLEMLFNTNGNFVVSGTEVIWDLKGVHLKTALQSTPTLIKKTVYGLVNAYPCRLKAIYIINTPKFYEPILNLIKLLVTKKIANRMHIYSTNNLSDIYKHVPKEILPSEYGGDAGPASDLADRWRKTIEDQRDKLLDEVNYYSDESKRPGMPQTIEDVFGLEGTFRKLEID